MESMIQGGVRRKAKSKDNDIQVTLRRTTPCKHGRLVFLVGKNIAKKANLKDGDRVDVRWDPEDGFSYICKSEDGVLVRPVSKRGTLSFSFARKPGFPLPCKKVCLDAVTVNGAEEILFEFPPSTLRGGEKL